MIELRPYQKAAVEAILNGPRTVTLSYPARQTYRKPAVDLVLKPHPNLLLDKPYPASEKSELLMMRRTLTYYHVQSALMQWPSKS